MKVAIADYGVGNLHSISKALERSGARTQIVNDMSKLAGSECIVFPGVGAFGAAVEKLGPAAESITSSIGSGTPTLGICLGMQIMFEKSDESRGNGLGVFKGDVEKLRAARVPQMGWNEVSCKDDPLFEGVPPGAEFYFANSYVCHPEEDVTVGETEYGERFASAVRRRAVCGVQFHPEKSGVVGLKVLSNFVMIAEDAL
jgi:glutamine amidotransferase